MTTTYATNILNCYNLVNDDERNLGMNWYPDAHNLAADIANGDVWRGAGVLAAYSPLTSWNRTVELACLSFAAGKAASGNLTQSINKAQRIIDGEHPLEVLRGQKTRAFACNIFDPKSEPVTIDSHAYSIAMGYWIPARMATLNKTTYRAVSQAYVEAASIVGIHHTQMQAITWIHWRNVHNRKGVRIGD